MALVLIIVVARLVWLVLRTSGSGALLRQSGGGLCVTVRRRG